MTDPKLGDALRARSRFETKRTVGPPDDCWLWTGAVAKNGYGNFRLHGRTVHRAAWVIYNGDPGELNVLHRCDTPLCVNHVRHLFLGTLKDNSQDMARKGRGKLNGTQFRRASGFQLPHTKLSETDVVAIRAGKGALTASSLAETYGVGERHIYRIWSGEKR